MKKRGRKLGGKNAHKKYETPPAHRFCPCCKRDRVAADFAKVPSRPSGLDAYCHECMARKGRRRLWLRRIERDGAAGFLAFAQHQQMCVQEMFDLLAEHNKQEQEAS